MKRPFRLSILVMVILGAAVGSMIAALILGLQPSEAFTGGLLFASGAAFQCIALEITGAVGE